MAVSWQELKQELEAETKKIFTTCPDEIKRFHYLVNHSVAVNPESAERQEIIDEYLAILYDQIYCMTTVIDVSAPLILHKDIKNVATAGFAIAAYMAAEQWYYDV